MSKQTTETLAGGKLTKQDLQKVYVRNLFGLQWGWNYETMQGLGYCYVIMPILRRLYRNDPEKMKKALKTEIGYFNTSQPMSHLIVGTDAALQEELGIDAAEDAIIGVKTGLMGPFAGVGDTVFITIYRALVFSIAAYIAMGGQAVALLIPLICGAAMLAVRYKFTFMAYEQGRKLASGLSGQLKRLTDAASVLGLTVVGALVPSVVKAPMNVSIIIGDTNPINIQAMLDKIIPAALPLAIVLLSYWLLGKKKMTTVKLILILMVVGVLFGLLNTFFAAPAA